MTSFFGLSYSISITSSYELYSTLSYLSLNANSLILTHSFMIYLLLTEHYMTHNIDLITSMENLALSSESLEILAH